MKLLGLEGPDQSEKGLDSRPNINPVSGSNPRAAVMASGAVAIYVGASILVSQQYSNEIRCRWIDAR
jgi:hypothetical protein